MVQLLLIPFFKVVICPNYLEKWYDCHANYSVLLQNLVDMTPLNRSIPNTARLGSKTSSRGKCRIQNSEFRIW